MSKKIYDILPPGAAKKAKKIVKGLTEDGPTSSGRSGGAKKHRKKGKKFLPIFGFGGKYFSFKNILLASLLIIVILGFYLFVKLPRATVQLKPVLEELVLAENVSIEQSADLIDLDNKVVPAVLVAEERTQELEFLATGLAAEGGKAEGQITVYNKITPLAPLTLIKGTRFLSDGGKIFTIDRAITVPPARYQQNKLVPGSVTVQVQASQAGEDFNVGPSSFSVPGLAGTAYYHNVYAESASPMQGGFTGKVKKVLAEDIEESERLLEEKILKQTEDFLREKISENQVLIEKTFSREIIDVSSSMKAGDIADKFTSNAKAKVQAFAVKKEDINALAQKTIAANLPPDKDFLADSLQVEYNIKSIDLSQGKAEAELIFSFGTYYKTDLDVLAELFYGKNERQIKEAAKNSLGDNITSTKVEFWPIWVNKAPKSKSRIEVELVFE